MLHDLSCLWWLGRRHLRSELSFYLWAFGADLDDRDLAERLYLPYLAGIGAVFVALAWIWALGFVEGLVAPAGITAESAALNAAGTQMLAGLAYALPVLCGAVWCVRAAWAPPFALSAPDLAVAAQTPVSAGAWVIAGLAPRAISAAAVGGVAGYFLADATLVAQRAAAGGPGNAASADPLACLPYAVALGAAFACARTVSWAAGTARLRAGRAARWPLALGLSALDIICVAGTALCLPVIVEAARTLLAGSDVGPLAVVLACLVSAICAVVALGRALPMRALSLEAQADASLYAARRMAVYNPHLYRELARRSRAAQRCAAPLLRMPCWHDAGAPLAHALISTVRRRDALPSLLGAGALLAPAGVTLLAGNLFAASAEAMGLLGGAAGGKVLSVATWALVALRCSDAVRSLTRVYRDDASNWLVRAQLPFSPAALLALDTVPALVVAALGSAVAAALAGMAGAATLGGAGAAGGADVAAASASGSMAAGPAEVASALGAAGALGGVGGDSSATVIAGLPFFACALALDVILALCGAFDAAEPRPGAPHLTCEGGLLVAAVALGILAVVVPSPYLPLAFWGVAGVYALAAKATL